ncbi:MAG: element excision factor XisI family protein [Geitlerinemataceae cyanobacterium]
MERLSKIDRQRQAIQDTLQEHYQIALDNPDHPTETFIASDPTTDNYFLLAAATPPLPQKYGVLIHLRLTDGKIVVETNNVGDFIEDLIDRGIPETDLVVPQRARLPTAP